MPAAIVQPLKGRVENEFTKKSLDSVYEWSTNSQVDIRLFVPRSSFERHSWMAHIASSRTLSVKKKGKQT